MSALYYSYSVLTKHHLSWKLPALSSKFLSNSKNNNKNNSNNWLNTDKITASWCEIVICCTQRTIVLKNPNMIFWK